jgi:hypothetical protein
MHVFSQPLFAPRLFAGVTVGQLTLASLSGVAAAMHAWVVPEHYEEYALFGVFFAVIGFAQAGWAAAVLRRPTRLLHIAGIALSAGLLAVWALSRTAGLPIGPEAWEAEPAELLDVVAGVAELGIIVVATTSLRVQRPASSSRNGTDDATSGSAAMAAAAPRAFSA